MIAGLDCETARLRDFGTAGRGTAGLRDSGRGTAGWLFGWRVGLTMTIDYDDDCLDGGWAI